MLLEEPYSRCLKGGVPISVCEANHVGIKQIDECECLSAFSYFTESNTGDISKCYVLYLFCKTGT